MISCAMPTSSTTAVCANSIILGNRRSTSFTTNCDDDSVPKCPFCLTYLLPQEAKCCGGGKMLEMHRPWTQRQHRWFYSLTQHANGPPGTPPSRSPWTPLLRTADAATSIRQNLENRRRDFHRFHNLDSNHNSRQESETRHDQRRPNSTPRRMRGGLCAAPHCTELHS
jgi:hypothetical protein